MRILALVVFVVALAALAAMLGISLVAVRDSPPSGPRDRAPAHALERRIAALERRVDLASASTGRSDSARRRTRGGARDVRGDAPASVDVLLARVEALEERLSRFEGSLGGPLPSLGGTDAAFADRPPPGAGREAMLEYLASLERDPVEDFKAAWSEGAIREAVAVLEDLILGYPGDERVGDWMERLVALRMQHSAVFGMTRDDARARLARVAGDAGLPAWRVELALARSQSISQEEAVAAYRRVATAPDATDREQRGAQMALVGVLARSGRLDAARDEVASLQRRWPGGATESFVANVRALYLSGE